MALSVTGVMDPARRYTKHSLYLTGRLYIAPEIIWYHFSTFCTRHSRKVIPCGTATCLWMDASWPVSYLYDLWRANAAEGTTCVRRMHLFAKCSAGYHMAANVAHTQPSC